jgi:hypothetical protein
MVKQKLKVKFDVQITKVENLPLALMGESVFLEWRRGTRAHGRTDSVVLCDSTVHWKEHSDDSSSFSFTCSMYVMHLIACSMQRRLVVQPTTPPTTT